MSQSELPTNVKAQSDRSASQTVYVVTVRWEGSPHPDVLGVYDSEEAADELMRKCRDWPRDYPSLGPVAWEKKVREVQAEFDPDQIKEQVP
jgi:hypothetical protein